MATLFPTTGTQEGDIAAGLISGGVYNPNISVDKIKPATPLNLPEAPATDNYSAILASLQGSLPEKAALTTTQEDIISKTTELGGEEAFAAQKGAELGLDTTNKELRNLQNQLLSVNTEAQAAALNLDRQGEPTRLTAAHNLDIQNIEKDRTIKALRLSASIQALQGNVALANDQVDRAVKLKYDPIKNQLNILNRQLEFNYKSFDAAEKKRADALKEANDIKIKELDVKQKAEEDWGKVKNEALSNNAPVSVVNRAEQLKNSGNENGARALLAPYTGAISKDKPTTPTASTLTSGQKVTLRAAGVSDEISSDITEAILGGTELETIRQSLIKLNLDPKILDTYDRVVNIANLLNPKRTQFKITGENNDNPFE